MNGELNMKFQISLFGDFSLLTPTEENIKKCIEGFFAHGLLPGNLQEFDPQTNKMEARLSLQSMRNGLNVNVLKNRIDFIAIPLPGTPSASLSLELFFKEVVNISDLVKETFDVTFKRIGVVTEKFLKEMSEEKIEELRKSFTRESFDIFPKLNKIEWNVRNIVSDHFPAPVDRETNIIYALTKVKVQMGDASGHKEFDTLHLNIDINIPSEKRNTTLTRESIESFLNKALEIHNQIYKGLTGVIYGAD